MDSTTSMDIEVNESNNDTDLTNMQNEANETIVTIPDMVCDSIAGASTEGIYKSSRYLYSYTQYS